MKILLFFAVFSFIKPTFGSSPILCQRLKIDQFTVSAILKGLEQELESGGEAQSLLIPMERLSSSWKNLYDATNEKQIYHLYKLLLEAEQLLSDHQLSVAITQMEEVQEALIQTINNLCGDTRDSNPYNFNSLL
ncbi:MAG TPA: hypothetical protein VJL87_05240 [Bdellovibrionota bacterium]|nr:hypothetical protein [Bdellovibrionota bacterium]